MERSEAASGQRAEDHAAVPAERFAVVIGEPGGDPACRIEAPDRLLRIWSLLRETHEQIAHGAPPPEAMPRLRRQLQAIRRELETTVSPPLAAELRRIAPPGDEAPSLAGLRIECAVLVNWTSSLTMRMLGTLEEAHNPLPRWPTTAASTSDRQ